LEKQMDTSRPAAIDPASTRKALPERKRQHRSPELKRQIVEETLAPDASVARVARAHGVNANQVFAWRRQYRQGVLESGKGGMPGLLAVRVAAGGAQARDIPLRPIPSGTMEIELPKGQLRLTGVVDREALRLALKELLA
jgi:transposase